MRSIPIFLRIGPGNALVAWQLSTAVAIDATVPWLICKAEDVVLVFLNMIVQVAVVFILRGFSNVVTFDWLDCLQLVFYSYLRLRICILMKGAGDCFRTKRRSDGSGGGYGWLIIIRGKWKIGFESGAIVGGWQM
jgi:hypothetical protein